MDETDYFFLEFSLALFFLVLLIFFSAIHSALQLLTPFDIKLLNEQQGNKNSLLAQLARDPLSVIIPLTLGTQTVFLLVFILTVHLALGWIASHQLLWAFAILLGLSIVFYQFIPRVLVQVNPDTKLLFLLRAFVFFFPVLRVFAYPISKIVERLGVSEPAPAEEEPGVMDKKIQALIAIGKEEEVFEKDEVELVKSVLEFGDTKVREVMTPRSQIVALPENATIKATKDLMVSEKHSRIPVYRESLDEIIGVIYVRNLLTRLEKTGWDTPITELLIPPVFVTEEERIREVFKEMKAKRSWMVFVKNEYGGISGLITIEDLLEEIVGDIGDEDQTEQQEIIAQGKHRFLVSGKTSLYELGEALGVPLEDDDCQTIGGFVTKTIGRLPRKNDRIEVSGIVVTVVSVDSRKVNRLLVEKSSDLDEKPQAPITSVNP